MNGILVLDKPSGWTSHDVVAKCRNILSIKRIGHTGTLDPFATGVLVLLVGKATRLAQFFGKAEKEYVAKLRFGFETTTGDRTGGPKSSLCDPLIKKDVLVDVLKSFVGEIEQIPPMFSAKKIGGKKLYELARKGIEIERKPIKVNIHKLELMELSGCYATVQLVCSAGTYVRSLAEDIGKKLEVGAHLVELRRIRVGKFHVSQAYQIQDLERAVKEGSVKLVNMNEALSDFIEKPLNSTELSLVKQGNPIEEKQMKLKEGEFVRLSNGRELVAIGVFQRMRIQPRVVLV
ncbi:MAG: tRNA pseudouridine(55) synthase TruB [Pyrinomonadaceae bacterium]|nr:tRNA pseudouridine(55) synthase TruB [Pyrinomonadaceae bacterium]MCX7640934.1 tRNA pseudouridine(55) synthase TruB [Pyrinomonadaceae bacterium]MDW8304716.1 tRNA pseudouridine(55) synthase TruB [Acidobacteriota bacterium]